jgi:hypothetical protein
MFWLNLVIAEKQREDFKTELLKSIKNGFRRR